jgi:hypothetical protein
MDLRDIHIIAPIMPGTVCNELDELLVGCVNRLGEKFIQDAADLFHQCEIRGLIISPYSVCFARFSMADYA